MADVVTTEPVQERHAHRARRRALAHRRVSAREARQGRRVRAHEAEGARVRRRRRPHLPGGEKFNRVHTEVKNVQYLYDDGDEVVFMDEETYDQMHLPRPSVEDALDFLQPSQLGPAADGRRQARRRAAPGLRRARGAETEPGIRGDTVSNVTKAASSRPAASCRCRCS